MKIAVLTTYFSPEENGITRYIEGLYSSLLSVHPEIEIEIITFDTLKTGRKFEQTEFFKIHRIESWQFMQRTYAIPTLKGFSQLSRIFAENKYDIINTHTRFFFSSFLGIRFGKQYGIPVIHTEHGSGFVESGNTVVNFLAKIYDYTLGKYTLKKARIVCGVSESVCDFAKKLGAEKTAVIYNGIETDFWKKKIKEEYQIKKELRLIEKETVITFVGRLVQSKGCQDIVKALGKIESFPWKFIIIGDGPYRKKLEEVIRQKRFNNKIIFLGTQKKARIRDILQVSDLFINPSFASEGMPTTILEAAAAGSRCLSSDSGGSVEILEKENLYPAGNAEKLAEKIVAYDKLKKTEVDRFDWKNISKKYFEILQSI